jgi:biopolymer transport protein ExbD
MRRPLRQIHESQHSSLSELNITPLLDLVFVMLVIFIIATPQLTNNLELSLPSGNPTLPEVAKVKPNAIVVTERGTILLNDQEVTQAQLKSVLAQSKAVDPNVGVIVSGAGDANYKTVVDVLDIINQLQITKVGLATETADAKPE